jgi:hypothetical protein
MVIVYRDGERKHITGTVPALALPPFDWPSYEAPPLPAP